MLRSTRRIALLFACSMFVMQPGGARAQDVAPYLADLKQYKVSDATVGQFLKGLAAEKKANADSLSALSKGDASTGSIGALMKCMNAGGFIKMGECGGEMAQEKSPQEAASGLELGTYDGMKQRAWIYFDGTPAERKAQFSAAELAALDKNKQALAAYRDMYYSPHPDGGGG